MVAEYPHKKEQSYELLFFLCNIVTDYRTFYEGYLKCVEFYNWLRENRYFYII